MSALVKLKEQGKIREIGMSNYNTQQLEESAQFGPIVSNQIRYSLLERGIEEDPLPYCCENSVGVICYSPMAMGLLTGKVTMERTFPDTDIRSNIPWFQPVNRQRVLDALVKIQPIADTHNATLAQLAVAWILAQEGITTALVGARNAKQVAENAAAGDIKLTAEEEETIRKVFDDLGPPIDG